MWKRRLRPRLEPNSQESVKESHGLEAAGRTEAAGGWPRKCKSHVKLEWESDTFEEAGGYADGGTEAGSGDGSEGSSLEADRQNNIKVL